MPKDTYHYIIFNIIVTCQSTNNYITTIHSQDFRDGTTLEAMVLGSPIPLHILGARQRYSLSRLRENLEHLR